MGMWSPKPGGRALQLVLLAVWPATASCADAGDRLPHHDIDVSDRRSGRGGQLPFAQEQQGHTTPLRMNKARPAKLDCPYWIARTGLPVLDCPYWTARGARRPGAEARRDAKGCRIQGLGIESRRRRRTGPRLSVLTEAVPCAEVKW